MDVVVKGGEEFAQLARRLRKAGEKDLLKELTRGIRETAKPIVAAQKHQVRDLPAHGARHTRLRGRVAGATRLQVRTGGRAAGVRIRVAKKAGLGLLPRHLNRGEWRHPVFGNREVWVTQTVPPGWFDRPAKAGAPAVRRRLLEVLDEVAEQIAHGGSG